MNSQTRKALNMNDSQTCVEAMDGAWPKEALPSEVSLAERVSWCVHASDADDSPNIEVQWQTAAAMFRDSGLAWLLSSGAPLTLQSHPANGGTYQIDHGHIGDSLLASIDKAIRAMTQS